MGSPTMERIPLLACILKRRRFLYLVVCALVLGGCSSKKVMRESPAQFKDINAEYAKFVKVSDVRTASSSTAATARGYKNRLKHRKYYRKHYRWVKRHYKRRKKVSMTEASENAVHLPTLEDSEGFIGRRPKVDPFRPGEKITFSVTYFNIVAGDLSLKVLPYKIVNGKKAYDFTIDAESNKAFSLFYSVEDFAETFVDFESLNPITYSIDMHESAQQKETKVFFDSHKNEATLWEKVIHRGHSHGQERKLQWAIDPYTQNVISAIFYLRTFTLSPGKKLAFRVSDNGKNYIFNGEVLRRETLHTKAGDFKTIVVQPSFHLAGRFQPTGENYIWLTDDDRKFPVKIECKIKIGSLIAKLKGLDKGT